MDHFSKWAEAIPVPNHTAPTVARALMSYVFTKYGAPKQLLSDRGPEFESELFSELMRWMEIDKIRTTPYKPSTNAAVERFHRTLNSMLGKVVKESQRDWDERLPQVMAAYRASPHSATGFSPNRLFLGRETRMPLDLVMGVPAEDEGQPKSTDAYVQKIKEEAEATYELAREELRVSAERRKKTYDVRVKKAEFAVGDWVWYWYPRRYTQKSPKWQKMYVGPYLITRVIQPVNYVLQKSSRSKPFVVHADKLKKCYGNTPDSWFSPSPPLSTEERAPETLLSSSTPEEVESAPVVPLRGQNRKRTPRVIDIDPDERRDDDHTSECIRPSRDSRRTPTYLRDYQC